MALGDYLEIDEDDIQVTGEEQTAATQRVSQEFEDENNGQTVEDFLQQGGYRDGVTQQASDRAYELFGRPADEYALEAARERTQREKYGLTGDKIYEEAMRLEAIASGEKKTDAQLDTEKKLRLLAQARRGQAASYGGFDAARSLEDTARGVQTLELTGDSMVDDMAIQAQRNAKSSLEKLLIAGEQRAEDKALAMETIAWQQEQANKSMWSNVLSGILGAVGAGVGFFATAGASTAVQIAATGLGASVGSSSGDAAGQFT